MKKTTDKSVMAEDHLSTTSSGAREGASSTAPASATVDLVEDTPGIAGALIDDTPDVIRMDLRKFNRAKQKVWQATSAITVIKTLETKADVDHMMVLLKQADAVGKLIEDKRKALGDPYRLETIRINECAKEIVKDLPGAIATGKALILAFHKREEERVKKERTGAREKQLETAGLIRRPTGHGNILVDHYTDPQSDGIIYRSNLEGFTDDMWRDILTNLGHARTRKLEERAGELQQQKDGATFFGEDTTEIDQKLEEAMQAPALIQSFGAGSFSAPKTQGLTKRWVFEVTNEQLIPRGYLQVNDKAIRDAIAAGARTIPGIRIFQDESISIR